MSHFPSYRPRRFRRTEALRSLVRETRPSAEGLILPLFVQPGEGVREPVPSMPHVHRTSVDELIRDGEEALEAGVQAVLLFGIPPAKDEAGTGAYAEDGIVQQAVVALKKELPDLVVITDLCLCEYTSHGHCGILEEGEVQNDPTLELLARTAVSQAQAGADVIAPSDMMDGRVAAIREALDGAGFSATPILSYAAKFSSAFYGPFRDAADSTPASGDRRGYQMDPANSDEAVREVLLDIDEGADAVLVKPALPYLDIVHRVKQETGYPVGAYHVSGEYSAILAAHERGWIDGDACLEEAVLAIRRAGADMVVTYAARQIARRLSG